MKCAGGVGGQEEGEATGKGKGEEGTEWEGGEEKGEGEVR